MIQNLIIALLVGMLLMQAVNASMVGLAGSSTRSTQTTQSVRIVNWPTYVCKGDGGNYISGLICKPHP